MTSAPSYGVTQNIQLVSTSTLILLGTYFRIPVSSRSFDYRTASCFLLDAKVNNGTTYFNKGFYRKGIRKNQRTKRTTDNKKIRKTPKKKGSRVGLNPSYWIPNKRRRSIRFDIDYGGIFVGSITDGGTFWAVMSCGGNVLAVGGFSFFGGNDFGGGGKTKVCFNFTVVGGFAFFGGNDFGGGGKTTIWR